MSELAQVIYSCFTNANHSRHGLENKIVVRLHYGKMKLFSMTELEGVDIVLTTYHTVSAEWKGGAGKDDSVLFTNIWRRIVLDEGAFSKPFCADMTESELMF